MCSEYKKINQYSLNPNTAKNLSDNTISVPMMETITPRWLLTFLPWVAMEAGMYRLNKLKRSLDKSSEGVSSCEVTPEVYSDKLGEDELPKTYPDYEENPREHILSIVQTILRINTQVTDLFNSPINQKDEQMRLTIETIKEKQEWEIINNNNFGLLNSVASSMKVQTRRGTPTPDDMDELIARVWKKPAFFLAHPKAIAAFGRECTRRGVPPVAVNLYGSPFITWRGIPLLPCDKLSVERRSRNSETTKILLMRVGEREQGVIGLHQPGIPDESSTPSLSVRFAGIDGKGIAHYVLSLYFGVAVLTDDALGVLEDVEVGKYHEYA